MGRAVTESTKHLIGKPQASSIVAALSELAVQVQRRRTVNDVLETAGRGILRLGMRLYAFEVAGPSLVLRYLATARSRMEAIESRVGRPIRGLAAPLAALPLVQEVVLGRRILHRHDLDLFHSFMRSATSFDPATLDSEPETAGINNGVLAPIFVRDEPWGLLGVVSQTLTRDDSEAIALFATHVGSAIEVAESIEALERTNRELAACYADLARAQQDLIERERLSAHGELAAVVAHEVRNPLCVLFNSIGGLHDFLRAGAPKERLSEAELFASMAHEEATQLNRIVTDLVAFARPHPPDLRIGSLLPVLEEVATATAPDGRVSLDIGPDLPSVQLDALFIRQALLNLVLTGLQAIAKDGTVKVRARAEQVDGRSFARIDVADDGPGISGEVRASIFEPFFATKPSATGVGLAVVKRVVDAHGGDIEVRAAARGTTFTVRLPAVDGP